MSQEARSIRLRIMKINFMFWCGATPYPSEGGCTPGSYSYRVLLKTREEEPSEMRRNLAFAYSLLTLSVAALAFAFYPLFVIYPFREQRPAPLMRALWVITHERLPLLAVFLVVLLCTVVAWRRARRAVKIFLLAPAVGIALLAFAAGCVNP